MGCSVGKLDFNPKRIHAKKLQEIYNNYLKNQGKDPRTFKGVDQLTPDLIESVSRYSQQTV
jgi:hypothetical protein